MLTFRSNTAPVGSGALTLVVREAIGVVGLVLPWYLREIRVGVVTVNCFGEGDASTPFGGYKESGFGGHDKSIWAHDQYTEIKTIWIDVSER